MDTLHDVMRSGKQKLRNRALLRNLSTLSPVLNNETRWSSTYRMIERFNDIREALIEVADSDDSELVIDRRVSFKNKTVKCANDSARSIWSLSNFRKRAALYQITGGHWTS